MPTTRPLGRLAVVVALVAAAVYYPAPVTAAQDGRPPSTRPAAGDAVADRVARIEGNLLPSTRVRGRDYKPAGIEQRMAELKVPAVSVAVINNGRIEWAKAWGVADVESGRPATAETLFQAASISKAVAATGALRLVEQGKLALDEPVNEKLTTWKIPDNEHTAKTPVTLRHLLSHTAGTTVHGFPGYAAENPVPTVQQVLDGQPPANTAAVRVDLPPGSQWRYSGGGYTVVQQLMCDVTGEPFEALIKRLVLESAGMAHSTYAQPLPPELAERAAVAYDPEGAAVPGSWHTYPEQAAAGLWTTPTDLGRWMLAIRRAKDGGEGALLSTETVNDMLKPGQRGWGLGVQIEGPPEARRFSHGGSNEGYRCYATAFVDGEERGIVVMTNGEAGAALGMELLHAVAREYGWPGFEAREIVPVAIDSAKLAEYAGTYAVVGSPARVRVVVEGGRIGMILPGDVGEPPELIPTGEDAFAVAMSGMPVQFGRDGEGKVVTLRTAGREARRVEDVKE